VDGTYSQRTFRRALDQLPADSDQYTACRDVINRARLAALDRKSNNNGSGGGGTTGGGGTPGGGTSQTDGPNGKSAPPCNGCTGSGTALDAASPKEHKGIQDATTSGSKPVRIGGQLLTPGSVGSLSSDSNHLPTPLVVLLAALGACALAAGGVAGWNRVLTRRIS